MKKHGVNNVSIFTTNYDISIEEYFGDRIQFHKGVLQNNMYSPELLRNKKRGDIVYGKLHGSIDLYKLNTQEIVWINTYQKNQIRKRE